MGPRSVLGRESSVLSVAVIKCLVCSIIFRLKEGILGKPVSFIFCFRGFRFDHIAPSVVCRYVNM